MAALSTGRAVAAAGVGCGGAIGLHCPEHKRTARQARLAADKEGPCRLLEGSGQRRQRRFLAGRIEAERVLGGATAQSATFEAMRQQDGVDSDREMETLLALERAYASNAKVLQAVDEMLQTMLRLT